MNIAKGTGQWLVNLSDDESRLTQRRELPGLFSGTTPALAIITESGLYKLVMRSDKPEARQFQDWVTREVLPAIRKDGMYAARDDLQTT